MGESGSNNELRGLAARITSAQGAGLFPAMAQYLAAMLHADEVLIGEAADELHARTLGVSVHGSPQPNYTFPLAGTPCEALVRDEPHRGESREESTTPAAAPPAVASSGYFGLALHGSDGHVIGFVCARSDAGMVITEHQHCLIEIVAVLLTTELQLLRAEQECELLGSQVHRLKSQLESMERGEVAAAATGVHRLPAFGSAINLDDTEATGLHHVQREHILRVLNATRWVIEGNSGAALKLGMKPATLRHRMKKLGIERLRHQP
jgi:Bacterial regulatory protein, Fis family